MELDLGLDAEESEPTVLEYARFHGLCKDYSLENSTLRLATLPSDEVINQDLEDPPNAPILPYVGSELTKERLNINAETASLLHAISSLGIIQDEIEKHLDHGSRIRGLKQEVPILETDHELDMVHFGSTATPSLAKLKIPLEPLTDEIDGGLEWPDKYNAYSQQYEGQIKAERLAMTRVDVEYLRDALEDPFVSDGSIAYDTSDFVHRKNITKEPITPPLLPMSPPMTPYIPSSPANHLQVLSDSSDSIMVEAKALQEQIMSVDILGEDDGDCKSMLQDMTEISDNPCSDETAPSTKRKAEQLHVETPLTPPMFSESPMKKLKTVTFSDIPHYIDGPPTIRTDDEADFDLKDKFEDPRDNWRPIAKEAKWRIEHEKLSEADTTKRVDVPFIEFIPPTAPWNEYSRGVCNGETEETELQWQSKFLTHIKRMHVAESWHGVSRLNRELPIEPFDLRSARVVIDEKLHGQEFLDEVLCEINSDDIVTSSTNIWKKDGLRLLEQEEEEEELEPMTLQTSNDINSIMIDWRTETNKSVSNADLDSTVSLTKALAQRSGEVEHTDGSRLKRKGMPKPSQATKKSMLKKSEASTKHNESSGSLIFGGAFSASGAMDKFIALHGMEVKPPKSHDQNNSVHGYSSSPSKIHQNQSALSTDGSPSGSDPCIACRPLSPLLPEPSKIYPTCSCIISAALLKQYHISRLIARLYPNAEFISRDFDVPYVPSQEADLVLSPSTGLILTTLQEIKQRALPGQQDTSKIKKRLVHLQSRYERLVVLVRQSVSHHAGEGGSDRAVDPRDVEAVDQFKQHAARLEGDILTRIVSGGSQALAQSIVEEMEKYSLPHGSPNIGDIKLLPDETNWELFLRRAGLNPFAAQVILALLKDPVNHPLASNSSHDFEEENAGSVKTFGLQTFLMMSGQQRIHHFQALLGGSRILRRVNALLDKQWISAAHGFHA